MEASEFVSVVVVNYRVPDLAADAIRSVLTSPENQVVDRIVVVDNDEESRVEAAFGELAADPRLRVLKTGRNEGFARACNLGVRETGGGFILLLNPDIVLLPGALQRSWDFLRSAGGADYAVCGVRNVDADGKTALAHAPLPSLVGEWRRLSHFNARRGRKGETRSPDDEAVLDVEQVIGSFFLVRRADWVREGGFDERFFLYYEEVDLSERLRRAGRKSALLAGAEVMHRGRQSSRQSKALALFHWWRGRTLFFCKHRGVFSSLVLVVMTVFLEFPARLVRAIAGRGEAEAGTVVTAFARYLRSLWTPGRVEG